MVRKYTTLRRVALILLVVLLMLTVTSCRVFRRPTPQGGMPTIPRSITRGDRLEPTIRVYLHETGQVQTMGFEEYLQGVVAAEMEQCQSSYKTDSR